MATSWDDRHCASPAPSEPSAFLTRFASLLPHDGLAIDLACGAGRHSVFPAGRGLRVVGIDRWREALEQGRELARRERVQVSWVQADLETHPLPGAAFDVIICFFYRDLRLCPSLAALRPGGILFFETFTHDQLRFGTGPRTPDYLLAPAELLSAIGDLEIVFCREARRGLAGGPEAENAVMSDRGRATSRARKGKTGI